MNVFISGASSGIGLATLEFLASKGYKVFGTTRDLAKRADLIRELKNRFGENVAFLAMDMTDEKSVQAAVRQIEEKQGGIDVLVSNAGSGIYGSIEETPMEDAIKQFDVNVFGTLRLLRSVLPAMRQRAQGKIILLSSIGGVCSIPFQSHYSATKYAIECLTEGLRQEVSRFGIHVSAIRPGDIHTDFNNQTKLNMPANSPYARWVKKCWETIKKNMAHAPKPILVAKTVHKIIKTRRPRTYYVSADLITGISPFVFRLLPAWKKQWLIRLFYEIDFK